MICIITLNVRGLRDRKKRSTIFKWLKKYKCDIAFLQETYCLEKDKDIWKREWGGDLYAVCNTVHSKGLITLISSRFKAKTSEFLKDENGRFLCVEAVINDVKYKMWNIYGPNKEGEKKSFLTKIDKILNDSEEEGYNIIGGDFNVDLDKETKSSKVKDLFKSVMNNNDLCDAWKKIHPKKKRFTWQRFNPPCTSTLDYIFIPILLEQNVKDSHIITAPRTDHLAVKVQLNTDSMKRGTGVWKFNDSLLKDQTYVTLIKDTVNQCYKECHEFLSKRQLWDLCKNQIRSSTIAYASRINKHRPKLAELENKMEDIRNVLSKNNTKENQELFAKAKLELEIAWNKKTEGAKVRSKEQWIQEGEKNTKYFLNLEKRNVVNKTITSLRKSDGSVITDQDELLNEQVLYYKSLYQVDDSVEPLLYEPFKQDINMPKLNEEERSGCEGELIINECFDALMGMQTNKSPGYDGLTVEFYKFFWPTIKHLVIDSLNEGFKSGQLASSQRKGIITLLHKGKDLTREELTNWRPITLINVDYKIATKVLAKRLQHIFPSIIDSDQTGYIKGRYIGENVRLIEDVLRYTENKDLPGLLLFLDFQKAFDSLDRTFLITVLEDFNFGPDFIKWVKTLYNGTSSCIVQNGNVSDFFTLERGVRQGCPLSALLFILAIEVIACKIRQNICIRGIKLPCENYCKNEVRISMYADDITLFLEDEKHVHTVLNILQEFYAMSGLKLNKAKTEALWIGLNKTIQLNINDLKWKLYPNNYVRSLGVTFCSSKSANEVPNNWEAKVKKIKNIINAWKGRNLTMVGKIIIIKSLLASQLTYVSSILNLQEKVVKELNTLLYQFVWGGKDRVKRKTIVNDYEKGGLKMINLPDFLESLKLSWIKRLTNETVSTWKNIAYYEFYKLSIGIDIFKCNCNYMSLNEICKKEMNSMNTFYRSLIEIWLKCKTIRSVDEVNNPGSEIIWNNENIKYNGKTLYFKHWIRNGYTNVSSLQTEDGVLKPMKHFNDKVKKIGGVMLDYQTLLLSISKEWKERKSKGTNEKYPNGIRHNEFFYQLELCTSKIIRYSLTAAYAVKPNSQVFWERKFPNYSFEWDKIWKNIPLYSNEAKLISLNWKILSNIYPTSILLKKIGKRNSSKCQECNEEDYLEHFFFNCKLVRSVWCEIESIILEQIGRKVEISLTDSLFGFYKRNKGENEFINRLIIIAKVCISKFKYGKHPNLTFLFKNELSLRNWNILQMT